MTTPALPAASNLPEMPSFTQFANWRKSLGAHPFLTGNQANIDVYVRNKLKANGYASFWEMLWPTLLLAPAGGIGAGIGLGLGMGKVFFANAAREIREILDNPDQLRAINVAFDAFVKKFRP